MMRVLAAVVCVALGVSACGGGGTHASAQQGTLSSTWQAPAVLSYVPADTPYLLATLQPIPRGWRDRMYASADERVAELQKQLALMPTDKDRGSLAPPVRAALAVLAELQATDAKHWTQALGFDEDGRFVIYGASLWPVLRYTVADPAKVTHFAQVAIDAAGVAVTKAELGGKTYWRYDDDGATIVGAIVDGDLVASMFPTSIVNEMLPLVLGTVKPAKSLADTQSITALMGHYQLMPASFGYVDLRATADIVMGRTTGSSSGLDRPISQAAGSLPGACRADIDRLVGLVPRVVLGYRKLDANGAQFRMIAELPAAVAAAIAKLRTAVPEVTAGGNGRALMTLGVAASYEDMVPLIRRVATNVGDHPFTCPWFARLNDAAADALRVIDRPMPPVLRTLRGFSFVMDDFAKDPPLVEAHATFVGPHLRDLMSMLSMFVPGFNGVTLPADGSPVPLPLAALHVPPTITAHVAATDERLSVAVGTGTEARVREMIGSGLPKHSPLFSMSMDFTRWAELGLMSKEAASPMVAIRDFAMQIDLIGDGLVTDMYMTFVH